MIFLPLYSCVNFIMSKKEVLFSNADNLPIESVLITVNNAGVVRQIMAIDPYWVEDRTMRMYEKHPSATQTILGEIEGWCTQMTSYLNNLKWLLGLEYHRFWSTILYHPNAMDSLVSFLQEANPPYVAPHETKDVIELYAEIRRFVLVVFSRLVTNRESPSQWMTREYMADIIYNKFIFTVPALWDLCLIYGTDNPKHTARLVNAVFELQPIYDADTTTAVQFVNEAFKYIILQVNNDYEGETPPNLPETFQGFSEIRRPPESKEVLTFDQIKDLILHMLDSAMTLRIFGEMYKQSHKIFMKANFVNSIVQIYEYGIPLLYEKLQNVGDPASTAILEVEGLIDSARAELIDIFRDILAKCKDDVFSGEGSIESHVETYISVMMDGISEPLFIRDYQACYPVHEDLEILMEACPGIDTVKTDFILQAIYSNLEEPIPEQLLNRQPITNGNCVASDTDSETDESDSTTDNMTAQQSRDAMISEVQNVLPDLGGGFILKCLEHYGFNPQMVINSYLEGNLAEPLRNLDQTLPIIPEDIMDKYFLETGIDRLNVFDGDQFDLKTRKDVDLSKIHVGKRKEKYQDLSAMLNDKTEVQKLRPLYNKYSLISEHDAMYSDEYDDTYDSDGGGRLSRPGPPLDGGRPFVTPRTLEGNEKRDSTSSEEEDEDEPSSSRTAEKNRMDFCQNPEEVRARRAAQWQSRGRGRGAGAKPVQRSADVVGKARGQGQEKEVLVNREKKEKNKSSRGNHSRRQGAQWKRSQGMMPS